MKSAADKASATKKVRKPTGATRPPAGESEFANVRAKNGKAAGRGRVFVANAWPYANNFLHAGHLAALLPGDVLARFFRISGRDVIFVSGSDCHGTPITERAKKDGVPPREIAERYHKSFTECFEKLGFSYDCYAATFDDYHKAEVRRIFTALYEKGHLYERSDMQDYCEKCGAFLSDREIRGICPSCGGVSKGDQCDNCLTSLESAQLKDRTCGACGSPTVLKENKSLMFKLSAFQSEIEKLAAENAGKWRANAVNETRKYLRQGLLDRAVTRDLSWGIDVPVEGFRHKKIYVWIEAVLGYYTACKRAAERAGTTADDFLRSGADLVSYYVHGKDNIPFHTVIFPALLSAMGGGYGMPDYIASCEYIKLNDAKMSKSSGNLLTVPELLERFDADAVRFYAILNNPEKKDASFSAGELINSYNKILAGGLGNFVNRNVSYLVKKFGGVVPEGKIDGVIVKKTRALFDSAGRSLTAGYTREALEAVTEYVFAANKFYDDNKPWVSAHDDPPAFNDTTATCLYMIANMSNLFYPFIPAAMDRLKAMLGLEPPAWREARFTARKLSAPEILFKRIEE